MSKVVRRGAAVLCNTMNQLQLVEVNVLGEWGGKGSDNPRIMSFDEKEAEETALKRIEESNRAGEGWAYVGTLFAETGGALSAGRINWGKDFQREERIV